MRQSESINEIATALGKAQREMMNPGFDKVNPHFKSKYASLAAVRDSIVNALSKQGIAVLQEAVLVDNGINCETRLFHSSGQWIACEPYRIPVDKGNAQGVASATTYARRISLQSFLVISADDDDDGGHAANAPPVQRHHQQRAEQPPTTNGHATMPKAEPTTADKLASIVKWIKNGRDQFAAGNFAEQVAKLDQRFVALVEGYTVGNAERAVIANLFDEARLEELMESDVQTAWETLRDFAATLTAKAA